MSNINFPLAYLTIRDVATSRIYLTSNRNILSDGHLVKLALTDMSEIWFLRLENSERELIKNKLKLSKVRSKKEPT